MENGNSKIRVLLKIQAVHHFSIHKVSFCVAGCIEARVFTHHCHRLGLWCPTPGERVRGVYGHGEQLLADVSSWALQKGYLKRPYRCSNEQVFKISPRRLTPNQPWGYFYQPLRAPRAHPLWVALRGQVVLTETHTEIRWHSTHTLADMPVRYTYTHIYIWYEPKERQDSSNMCWRTWRFVEELLRLKFLNLDFKTETVESCNNNCIRVYFRLRNMLLFRAIFRWSSSWSKSLVHFIT